MDGDPSIIPQLIGSSAISAFAVAVLNALFNRRKFKAETTSIISQAAGGLVEQVSTDNTRLRAENAVLLVKVDELREKDWRRDARDEEVKRAIFAHNEYDMRLAKILREAGIQADDPPPITWVEVD